jgi:hypothetical protein
LSGQRNLDVRNHHLNLILLPGPYAVCRLPPDVVPAWATLPLPEHLVSITRTSNEVTVVCPADAVPAGVRCEKGWQCLRVAGTLDFSLVGVLASLLVPLAEAGVSVFCLSTFDTDYILIREQDLPRGTEAWQVAGHAIEASG